MSIKTNVCDCHGEDSIDLIYLNCNHKFCKLCLKESILNQLPFYSGNISCILCPAIIDNCQIIKIIDNKYINQYFFKCIFCQNYHHKDFKIIFECDHIACKFCVKNYMKEINGEYIKEIKCFIQDCNGKIDSNSLKLIHFNCDTCNKQNEAKNIVKLNCNHYVCNNCIKNKCKNICLKCDKSIEINQNSTSLTDPSTLKIDFGNNSSLKAEDNCDSNYIIKETVKVNREDLFHSNIKDNNVKIIDDNKEGTKINYGYNDSSFKTFPGNLPSVILEKESIFTPNDSSFKTFSGNLPSTILEKEIIFNSNIETFNFKNEDNEIYNSYNRELINKYDINSCLNHKQRFSLNSCQKCKNLKEKIVLNCNTDHYFCKFCIIKEWEENILEQNILKCKICNKNISLDIIKKYLPQSLEKYESYFLIKFQGEKPEKSKKKRIFDEFPNKHTIKGDKIIDMNSFLK